MRPVIPDSFRDRPYARERFAEIASWAAQHHPFYAQRVSGEAPEFPVITRRNVQDGNDLLLNGFPVTARTSGSTATPVRVSWSRERSTLERRDSAHYLAWLGGPMPSIRILALSVKRADESTIDVGEPIQAQVEFMLRLQR